ncbi:hypothetical protein Nepgr_019273 [Nepenthes gracilis]|uniref:Uncharacterized protein n=1 Tax=Nepenthes gracilis TaxID=150966 RepID=A0AAD3SVM5_NEPGR|nr:hypothetical protein Nepgr_019273 [Nepenthes gracilis]
MSLTLGPRYPRFAREKGWETSQTRSPHASRSSRSFQIYQGLGRCPSLRSTLLRLLEMGLVQRENLVHQRNKELSHRDQNLVNRSMLEEMEG